MLLQSVSTQSPDMRAITPHAKLSPMNCAGAYLAGKDGSIHDAAQIAEFPFSVN
jgi:hypothetical protein